MFNAIFSYFRNILLNYAVENPRFGYTQGMSDLLAPVLAEIQKEVDAYWCFTGLMQRTIFVSSPKDCDMDKQLVTFVQVLVKLTLLILLFLIQHSTAGQLEHSMTLTLHCILVHVATVV